MHFSLFFRLKSLYLVAPNLKNKSKTLRKAFSIAGLLFFIIIVSCKKDQENTILYQSSLRTYDRSWYNGYSNGYSCRFEVGYYSISITQAGYLAYSLVPIKTVEFSYSITVDVAIQLTDTTKLGYAGCIYNFIDINNYTAFLISSNEYYQIYVKTNGTYAFPTGWIKTDALKKEAGVDNTIELDQSANKVDVVIESFPGCFFCFCH